jgi:hypothetical protein
MSSAPRLAPQGRTNSWEGKRNVISPCQTNQPLVVLNCRLALLLSKKFARITTSGGVGTRVQSGPYSGHTDPAGVFRAPPL